MVESRLKPGTNSCLSPWQLNEVLLLEDSSINEILYSAQVAQTELLDLGSTFDMTSHREWFLNYTTNVGSI